MERFEYARDGGVEETIHVHVDDRFETVVFWSWPGLEVVLARFE